MSHYPTLHTYQVFNDVPAIESGDASLMGDCFAPAACLEEYSQRWRWLDPIACSYQSFDGSGDAATPHLQSLRRQVLDLENSVSGHASLSPTAALGHEFSCLDLQVPLPSDSHALQRPRYMPPSGHLGGSLSSIDSASECASSPDAARYSTQSSYALYDSQEICSSPIFHEGAPFGHWGPRESYQASMVPTATAGDHRAAYNMKYLQYGPDLDVDVDEEPVEEPVEDADCIKVELPRPQEPSLLLESSTFRDEALGQSIRDDASSTREDEEDTYVDSEAESEYHPGLRQGRNSTQVRSPVQKTPKRRLSKSTTVLGEPKIKKAAPRSNGTRGPAGRTPKGAAATTTTTTTHKRVFTCAFAHYGCEATFRSKNEWKRHVGSQHLQLGFYRCDTVSCNPNASASSTKTYNDFNRKDLFTQHHRRMHTPWSSSAKEPSLKMRGDFENSLEDVRKRCWHEKRAPPQRSTCGFCRRVFEGPNGWDERMEHVGKHFEGKHGGVTELGNVQEEEDEDLTDWAVGEGIVKDYGPRGFWLVGMEPAEVRTGTERSTRRRGGGHQEVPDEDDLDAEGENE